MNYFKSGNKPLKALLVCTALTLSLITLFTSCAVFDLDDVRELVEETERTKKKKKTTDAVEETERDISNVTAQPEETVAPEYTPELSDTNWSGKEFIMLTSNGFWGEEFDRLTRVDNKTIDTHEWLSVTGTNTQDFASVQAFINGRALFFSSNASNMSVFRNMENDFIVLPMPLLSEGRDYCSYVYSGANVIAIPVLNKEDLAFTGFVLEALAAESYKTVTPAYYEKTLKGKYSRDERSFEMLDVVFRNRSWNLGYICSFGGVDNSLISQIKLGSGTFSSFYRRNEKKIKDAINEYVEAYEKSSS